LGGNELYRDGKGEFWDSYGQAPGFYSQNFTQFLKITQAPSSDVCGQYTLFFVLHQCRHIPMSTVAKMFTDSKEWNDELVRDFIDKWYK
jgi:hypothetical protein